MTLFNKNGNAVQDTLTALIIIVVFAIVAVFGYTLMSQFNDEWQDEEDVTNISKEVTQDFTTSYPIIFDNAFILLVVMLWIGLIVMSFFIDAHPIFFVIPLMLLIFVFAASAFMSNYFEELTDEAELSDAIGVMPKMNWVMDNLLIVMIIIGFTTTIALYSKTKAGG